MPGLASLPYPDKETSIVKGPDPLIVGSARQVVDHDDPFYATINGAARETLNTDG